MQKENGSDGSLESALALWQHAQTQLPRKRRNSGILPLAVIFLIGSLVTVLSYFLYDPNTQMGNFMMATEVFEDFMEDAPAVAVFLGLGDDTSEETGEAEAREKKEQSEKYIGQYRPSEK